MMYSKIIVIDKRKFLFMDLRQVGEPFEKKYIQFSDTHLSEITSTYHNWQKETTTMKMFQNIVTQLKREDS